MRRLIQLARPHFARISIAIVLVALCSAGLLAIPLVLKGALGSALRTNRVEVSGGLIALLVALVMGSALANVMSSLLMFDVAVRISSKLRLRYIRHLLHLPVQFHRSSQAGDLLDRLLTSAFDVEGFFQNSVGGVVGIAIATTGAVVMMFLTSWKLSLLVLFSVPLMGLLVRKLFRTARQFQERGRKLSGRLTGSIAGLLLGIEVVKAYNSQERSMDRLTRQQEAFFHLWKRGARVIASVEPILIAVGMLLFLFFLLSGSYLLASGELRPEELIAFLMYLMILMPQTRIVGTIVNRWQQVDIALNRLDEILRLAPERDHENARPISAALQGRIDFDNVCMTYENRQPALIDVSFRLKAGERVGLVGESGAGKTTLFNLLLRFYNPESGTIKIDGTDISSLQLASVRSAIALVPQDTVLFDDTIAENVRYGRVSATDAEVMEACRSAQIDDFVRSLPQGYQTVLADRGQNLSGGQRQRLAIARALLKRAPILLMDEPTSSLDAQTEEQLKTAIEVAMEGRTTLIIAHRLATVAHLPRIIVLSHGRIVADGSHHDLLERCERYREIVATQMAPLDSSPSPQNAEDNSLITSGVA